ALVVNRGHIAGAEPAIGAPARGLIRGFVVFPGDPRAAYLEFACGLSVPWGDLAIFYDACFHKRCRPSLLGAHLILFLVGPIFHVWLERASRTDRGRFGHTPQVANLEAEAIHALNE